jgi:Uma2 family endonuclease
MEHNKFAVPSYTYSDYKNWKEDWELINGYPFSLLPSPKIKHQKVSGVFYLRFSNGLLKYNNCNCICLYETDWIVNDETVVRPDLMILCDTGKEEDYPTQTPRLIVEIFSPSTIKKDRNQKFYLYQERGVPYYIMVDPDNKSTEYYQLIDNQYKSINKPAEFILTEKCTMLNEIDDAVFD